MAEPGDCYEEIFQLVCHVLRKAKRRSAALYYTLRGKPAPASAGRGNRRSGGNVNGDRHHLRHHRCKDLWKDMRRKLWGIVESKYFSRGIMVAILINTISMGIEHHNQVR
ncbi:hypothetical protein XENOCAPTIV_017494 [Xenoophorus captivus]|uniref:Uncharacterized protein n=1 Tax=Xenoophorus captivus TaxID=1517983 RepID=A0ABV0RHU3_9TELE